jgi:putative FmdB family regulatory protein
MPVYEYECGSCCHRFDKRQGFDDEPKAVCPRCEGQARRVFHAAPVIFKGSGFYVTDHRPAPMKDKEPDKGSKKSESKGDPAASQSKSESTVTKSQ